MSAGYHRSGGDAHTGRRRRKRAWREPTLAKLQRAVTKKVKQMKLEGKFNVMDTPRHD